MLGAVVTPLPKGRENGMSGTDIPTKTPSLSESVEDAPPASGAVRGRPVPEDPLLAQGRAFWASQRFDTPARAIYTHLAEGQAEVLRSDRQPWARALEIAEAQAHLMQVMSRAKAELARAKEIVAPERPTAETLCKQFPSSPDLNVTCATFALFAGDEESAARHFETAMLLGWRDWVTLSSLVFEVWEAKISRPGVKFALWWLDQCESSGDWDGFEKAVRLLTSSHDRPVSEVIQLREGLTDRPHRPDAPPHMKQIVLIERARFAVWAGIATEALTLLEELKPGELRDPELCIALARTLIAHDDIRRAFDYLAPIPLDKTTKILLNEIAVMLERQGDIDGAVYVLQHINRHDQLVQNVVPPSDREIEAETALAMAQWQLRQGRASSALGQFFRALSLGVKEDGPVLEQIERLLEAESHPEPYWQRLADHYAQRGDLYHALTHYRRLQRHLTYGPRARTAMRRALDRLIAKSPEAPQLRLESGMLHMQDQDFERAIEEFKGAAQAPEIEMQAHQQLALCYYHTGQFALALDLFHAVPINEEMLEALTAMSHQLEQSGLYREALEAARMIHTHDPLAPHIEDRIIYLTQRVHNAGTKGVPGDDRIRELLGEPASVRYRYVSKIGSGGMGIVYKVFDNEIGTHVALKILRESLSSSAKAIDRFFREARIAASLHHPNIVNIFDYSVMGEAGPSYISMEYVDGPSLREIIESKFASTFDVSVDDILDALNYNVQLCDALNTAHRQGIIHRDIKPDNIMLNSGGVVKITDFGIVHVEEATFTPTGALIGTPRYMSPEQVQGRRVDGRSDLYAVGIILYELLVGTPPFISGDIAYQQVNVVPTRPREICPAIPPEVDRIIMKCLEKRPEDRFNDARALRRALAEAYHNLLPQGVTPRSRLSEDPGGV
jgi:tetratricopeptide (TPR) repeat protein